YRQQLGEAIAQGVQTYNAAVSYRSVASNFAYVRRALPPHASSITAPLHEPSPVPRNTPPAAPVSTDGASR
ncbi:MAG: hypothetical protein ABI883_03770, partial [Chthoniobacterales bacterium]